MTDANLLAAGCAVTFIAAAGAYVYIRESYMAAERKAEARIRRAERPASKQPKQRDAA